MNSTIEPIVNERPEVALLLLSARTHAKQSSFAAIQTLLQRPLDWPALLTMANRNGLSSMLYWSLNQSFGYAVPAEVMSQLKRSFDQRVKLNLFLTGELIFLIRLFESHGLEPIPWKGPALAACAHGNLALREFCDLDVLVRREDLAKAKELLQSRGYVAPGPFTARQEETYLWLYDGRAFTNPRNRVMVDLHWAITPKAFSFRFNVDRLWKQTVSAPIGGVTVRGMLPEYLLLTLCVHGSKHCWAHLSLVCDISEFLNAHDGLDWTEVSAVARESGAERMLLLGLFLAHELLDANVPETFLASAIADRIVPTLAKEVIARRFSLETSPPRHRGRFRFHFLPTRVRALCQMYHFHWRAKENLSDRIRFFGAQFVPTCGDWTSIALPDRFFPLYYVIRPFRLIGKYSTLAFKNRTQNY